MIHFERSRRKFQPERNSKKKGRCIWEREEKIKSAEIPQPFREYKLFVDSIFHPKKRSEEHCRIAQNVYQSLSSEEKENLICAVANQILRSHSDYVRDCVQYLHHISVELGQKTEVEFYRLRFGREL